MAESLRVILFCLLPGLTLFAQTETELRARAANASDPHAVYLVGIEFWTRGMKDDAIRCYTRAADRGDEDAKGILQNLRASGQLTKEGRVLFPDLTVRTPAIRELVGFPSSQDRYSASTIQAQWPWLSGPIYTQAGLNRLTNTERTALNNYISSVYSVASIPMQSARPTTKDVDLSGFVGTMRRSPTPPPRVSDEVIETTINGEFHGWDGETIFRLMSGQIWQQVEYDYEYTYDYMPDILIYRSRDGSWKLQVKDIDHPIEVRRIK